MRDSGAVVVASPNADVKARLLGGALSILTLSATLVQLQVLFAFPRPARIDYLVFLWCLVPRLWPDPDPLRYLRVATWAGWGRELLGDLRRPRGLAGRFRRAFGLTPV